MQKEVMDVALYPSQSRVVTRGSYVLENRTNAPLQQVHVNLDHDLQVTQLELDGAKLLDGHPEEEIEAAFLAARLDHMALPYSKTWLRLLFS